MIDPSLIGNCVVCGNEFTKSHSTNQKKYCSDECRIAFYRGMGKFLIFKRDEFRCVYCGKSSIEDGIRLTLDHVIPRNLDGSNDIAMNLVTSCSDCNSQKSDTILSDDLIVRLNEAIKKRNEASGIHDYQKIKSGWL